MNNFVYHVPTKICFGQGEIRHLAELRESGSRVLLVYGGGSIKKSGIYDTAMGILEEAGLTVLELSGIEPNPRVESVREGIRISREGGVEMVLAIGGGSVIDAAKAIAAGTCYDGDVWDLVEDGARITKALPVYTVLTLAATGSEMNKNAVLSDLGRKLKSGMSSELLKPRMSILDPTYTYSVSRRQTAAGTADMMSHTFENYFSPIRDSYLSMRFDEAILRTCIHYGPIALQEPDNYEARANLMWTSSNAINGIGKMGAEVGWTCHPLEHELSAYYDINHGEGLAILTPRWMRHILGDATAWKLAEYGRNVWDLDGADDRAVAEEAIRRTEDFFYGTMGMPRTLAEVGIQDDRDFEAMAEHAAQRLGKAFVPLTKEDALAIYRSAAR